MIIAVLILLGLALGSFVNAFVWRLHQQALPKNKQKVSNKDLSIVQGRSVCVHCGHKLKTIDLIPVISWLSLRGKCRYCKKPISWQYPVVELSMAVLYVASYVLWPYNFDVYGTLQFVLWLISLTGLTALFIYDIRWMLLPNKIIFPLYGVAALSVLVRMLENGSLGPLFQAVLGVFVGGGIFYVLFQISKGAWIGGGDVKLGFLLGGLAGSATYAMLTLFLASMLGTISLLPLLATGKVSRKARIPFGPFLIAAAIVVILLGDQISNWYFDYLIYS